jgi:hypothetical protein
MLAALNPFSMEVHAQALPGTLERADMAGKKEATADKKGQEGAKRNL